MIYRLDLAVTPHQHPQGPGGPFWTEDPGWDRAHARLPRLGERHARRGTRAARRDRAAARASARG